MYGETPPEGTAVNVPLARPLHVTVTLVKVGITIALGWVIVALAVEVQPFEPVTVTVNVPAVLTEVAAVVAPFDHK